MQDGTGSGNHTTITQVILLGLTSHRKAQVALFALILLAYLLSMTSHLFVIVLALLDVHLRTPMYFFLANLSFLEMVFTSCVVPQMLAHLLAGHGRLPFTLCLLQMYVACSLACAEELLLGVMAYDRYLAICCPLAYRVAMSKGFCQLLVALSWAFAFSLSGLITASIMRLPFCGPNTIDHVACEFLMVTKLGCTDTSSVEAVTMGVGVIVLLVPLATILVSYGLILATVVRMTSGAGRNKAFSTCASHLLVVTMFYGCFIALYMRPRANADARHVKYVSIFFIVITPLLNPVIYTLRNKDVHTAVARLVRVELPNIRTEWS